MLLYEYTHPQSIKERVNIKSSTMPMHLVSQNDFDQRIQMKQLNHDTAPTRTPKQRLNLTYSDAAANVTPMIEQSTTSATANAPTLTPTRTQDSTSGASNDNSSRLAELESSIQSIDSERSSLQYKFKGIQAEFQKVITSAL
jgi:hypothetical protein